MKEKIKKHIKNLLILLFGIQHSTPVKMSLDLVDDIELKNLLSQDDFGVYKKENVKIPLKYKKVYKRYKFLREEMIYIKYYKLNSSFKYGLNKDKYLFESIVEPSKSDKIVVEELLNKGWWWLKINLSGIYPEYMKDISGAIQEMLAEYPVLKKMIKIIH